jgi:predicted dehydrogenase
MLHVALIGSGKWGKNYIKAIADSGLGEVTTVVSASKLPAPLSAADSSSTKEGLRTILASFDINRARCDAAIVSTHPPLTERYSQILLEEGISVMAEKPFTFDSEALDNVQSIIDSSIYKPTFLINHQHLFSPAIQFIAQNLKGKSFNSFYAEAGGSGPRREYPPLCDYGPHDLSILAYLSRQTFDLIRYDRTADSCGLTEGIKLRTSGGIDVWMTFWNNRLPKTHKLSLKINEDIWRYDDFDPQGQIQINKIYQQLTWSPPLSLAVSAFLERVAGGNKGEDLRFGTGLAKTYTRIFNDIWIS